jgi:hypothetical protein
VTVAPAADAAIAEFSARLRRSLGARLRRLVLVTFSGDDAKACLGDAEVFRAEVVTTLRKEGWIA